MLRTLALLAASVLLIPRPAAAQDQGFTWVRLAPPGMLRDIALDFLRFWQSYRLFILGIVAFFVLRWLWNSFTPRGYRD